MKDQRSHNIIIYSIPRCPFCAMTKKYLAQKNLGFEEIDVTKDPDLIEIILEKSGQAGVPVIDIDGKIIVGFDRVALDETLLL